MADYYIGQIIAVGFNFAPRDWMLCDGSLLAISDYQQLFALIGTIYGGDGQHTFQLPDLRGRIALGAGQAPGLQNYVIGQFGGAESVSLTPGQFAAHAHSMTGANAATASAPGPGVVFGATDGVTLPYGASGASAPLATSTVSPAGGAASAQPHENRQPYTAITYIICTAGAFPPLT